MRINNKYTAPESDIAANHTLRNYILKNLNIAVDDNFLHSQTPGGGEAGEAKLERFCAVL